MTESRCPACTCIGFHTEDCNVDEMTLRDRITTAILNAVYDPLCTSAARSAADAILALPGIAVVELPEPDYGPDGEGQSGWSANGADIMTTPDEEGHWSVWDGDCQLEPHEARDLAAAFLAAANYAEGNTDA